MVPFATEEHLLLLQNQLSTLIRKLLKRKKKDVWRRKLVSWIMWNNTWRSPQLSTSSLTKAGSNNSWKILHARRKLLLHLILLHLDYERIRRLCWTWHSMKLEFCSFWHQPICYGALKKNPCFISRYPDWPYLRLCMYHTRYHIQAYYRNLNVEAAVCIKEFFSLHSIHSINRSYTNEYNIQLNYWRSLDYGGLELI